MEIEHRSAETGQRKHYPIRPRDQSDSRFIISQLDCSGTIARWSNTYEWISALGEMGWNGGDLEGSEYVCDLVLELRDRVYNCEAKRSIDEDL